MTSKDGSRRITVSPYGITHFVDRNGVTTACGLDLSMRLLWPVLDDDELGPISDLCRRCVASNSEAGNSN